MSSDPIKKSSNKFNVPPDIESKFNDLYKFYKDAASKDKLDELGINDQDTFEGLFSDDEGVEILLEGLEDETNQVTQVLPKQYNLRQIQFMETSGITQNKKGGGRNRKRRSKKRRGNRRKSTRRRSRR